MNIEVIKKERKHDISGLSVPRNAKYIDVAKIKVGSSTFYFSRYDTETEWYLDSHFENDWMPVFHHGEGSRCCTKKVAKNELEEAINNAEMVAL